MRMQKSRRIFDEFQIGGVRLKNRVVLGPVDTRFDLFDRGEYELALKFLCAATRNNGAGLVVLPNVYVHFTGKNTSSDYTASFRYFRTISGLSQAIHKNGSKVIIQLSHSGAAADHPFAVAASPLKNRSTGRTVHSPGRFLIKWIESSYVKSARHAVEFGGVDGVEIDGSGMTLPNTFTSLAFNKRKDFWGRKTRFNFSVELVKAIKSVLPKDAILSYRISLMDLCDKGMSWNELIGFIYALLGAGVNHLSFGIGIHPNRFPIEESCTPENAWVRFMSEIAEIIQIPISFSKKLSYEDGIDELAEKYSNSLFEYTTPYLTDPDFTNKLHDGLAGDIVQAMYSIDIHTDENRKLFCPLNPLLTITPPEKTTLARKFLVVGAGPSGIGFAYGAALKGHIVKLVDDKEEVGGLFSISKKIPGYSSRSNFSKYWEKTLKECGVELILNTEVDLEWIQSNAEDMEIVLACGFESKIPDVLGIDSPNVLTFENILLDELPVGKRISVIGDTVIGRCLCMLLAIDRELDSDKWLKAWGIGSPKRHIGGTVGVIPEVPAPNREILLLSEKDWEIGHDIQKTPRAYEMQWLRMHGIQTLNKVKFEAVDNFSLKIRSSELEDMHEALKVDHIILASDFKPKNKLRNELQQKKYSFMEIGMMNTPNTRKTFSKLVLEGIRQGILL